MKRLIFTLIFLCTILNFIVAKDYTIVHASDIHFLSHRIAEVDEHFMKVIQNADGKVTHLTPELTSAFVYDMLKLKPDAIILSGDLTLNGALESHEDLIKTLKPLIKANIPVLVIPGNHDCDGSAYVFKDNETYEVDSITSSDFLKLYKDFGYSNTIIDNHSLSYFYKLSNKLWILMLDVNANDTFYRVKDESLVWLEENLKKAKKEGALVISSTHQPLTIHNKRFTFGYQVSNSNEVLPLYKKYGVKLNLSGHLHLQHITKEDSFVDIAASSLAVSSNQYGIIKIKDNKLISYETKSVDVSAWAKSNNINSSELLNFSSYSESFFDNTTINKLKGKVESIKGLSSSEVQLALSYAAKLNREYFAGHVKANKNDAGWKLWEEKLSNVSFYSYLYSIVNENKEDNTRLIF